MLVVAGAGRDPASRKHVEFALVIALDVTCVEAESKLGRGLSGRDSCPAWRDRALPRKRPEGGSDDEPALDSITRLRRESTAKPVGSAFFSELVEGLALRVDRSPVRPDFAQTDAEGDHRVRPFQQLKPFGRQGRGAAHPDDQVFVDRLAVERAGAFSSLTAGLNSPRSWAVKLGGDRRRESVRFRRQRAGLTHIDRLATAGRSHRSVASAQLRTTEWR